jgi:threonine synthase
MLSPKGRMSPFQQAQMFSLADANIHNIAIEGVFDDCQDIVKAVSADAAFKARYRIGTVNSINFARVAAQVVYYFRGYFAVAKVQGEPVDFAVPSGNFGNILAGHVAREMGLPIRRLILATNENDVLDEFFRTGRYRPRRAKETHATSSPSMDISKASNFERYIFDVVGRDPAIVRGLWASIEREGGFELAGAPHWARVAASGFVSGVSTHADRIATIRRLHARHKIVVDPHTADGIKVGLERRDPRVPLVCIETALPAKFSATIKEALGREPERPAAFADLEQRPQKCDVLPPAVNRVKAYIENRAAAVS